MRALNENGRQRVLDECGVDAAGPLAVFALWMAVPNMVMGLLGGVALLLALLLRQRLSGQLGRGLVIFPLGLSFALAASSLSGGLPPANLLLPVALAIAALLRIRRIPLASLRGALIIGTASAGIFYLCGTMLGVAGFSGGREYAFFNVDGSQAGSRFGSFGMDPNVSVAIVVLIAATTVALIGETAWSGVRLVSKVFLYLAPIAIIASVSRLAVILGGLVYIYLLLRRLSPAISAPALVSIGAGLAIVVAGGLAIGIPAFEKLAGTDVGPLRSDNLRFFLWQRALDLIPRQMPLGSGWGRSGALNAPAVGFDISFHSSWLIAVIELGVAGGVVIGAAMVSSIWNLSRRMRVDGILLAVVFVLLNSFIPFIYSAGPFVTFFVVGWWCSRDRAIVERVDRPADALQMP